MKYYNIFIAFAFVMCLFAGCKKEIQVPAEVAVEDLIAILQEDPVDVAKVVAYAPKCHENFEAQVEKLIQKNDALSDSDLVAQVKNVKDVAGRIKALGSIAGGDYSTPLNSVTLKFNRTIESAERYLANKKTTAAPKATAAAAAPTAAAAAPTAAAAAPAAAAQPAAPARSYTVYSQAWDGYVNIRQYANANSAILGSMVNGGDGAVYLGRTGNWYKVNYHGTIGYCHVKHSTLR